MPGVETGSLDVYSAAWRPLCVLPDGRFWSAAFHRSFPASRSLESVPRMPAAASTWSRRGRSIVWALADRPARCPPRTPRQGRRSLPAPAGSRHVGAVRTDDVPDAGRVGPATRQWRSCRRGQHFKLRFWVQCGTFAGPGRWLIGGKGDDEDSSNCSINGECSAQALWRH
jgi:hypothetical protein